MRRLSSSQRPWAGFGALLLSLLFSAPRAVFPHDPRWLLIAAASVGFLAGLAFERTGSVVKGWAGSSGAEAQFAAVLAWIGGALVAIGAYVGRGALIVTGGVVVGLAAGALPVPAGGRARLAAALVTGGAYTLVAPVVAHTVARFALSREFDVALAQTSAGRRFATVVALAVCVWAMAALLSTRAPAANPSARRAPARRSSASSDALLHIEHLDLHYGSVQVLFDVSFDLREGEALALLGPNGAGKSSLLRGAFGLVVPSGGTVTFAGADITGARAERLVRAGMIQIPGGSAVFPSLTVGDNLRAAGHTAGRRRIAEGIERACAMFPHLATRFDEPAGLLSGGEQQMLALGRAWIARPRLLAIDELTLGLAPVVVDTLVTAVQSLQDEGVSLLLVDQSVRIANELCPRAVFLERGAVRYDGPTAELVSHDDLLRSIFLSDEGPTGRAPASGPVA